jgi:hypothetical protein
MRALRLPLVAVQELADFLARQTRVDENGLVGEFRAGVRQQLAASQRFSAQRDRKRVGSRFSDSYAQMMERLPIPFSFSRGPAPAERGAARRCPGSRGRLRGWVP